MNAAVSLSDRWAGPARDNGELLLLVTAHSLPVRIVQDGDPYEDQLRRTAELVASASGQERWDVGWQSAGRTPEPWLGPDILERLRGLPAEHVRAVVLPRRLHFGSPRDPLRPRHRGAARALAKPVSRVARTARRTWSPRLCAALAELVVRSAETI